MRKKKKLNHLKSVTWCHFVHTCMCTFSVVNKFIMLTEGVLVNDLCAMA